MKKLLLILFLTISSTLFAQLPKSLLVPVTKVTEFDDYKGSIYSKINYKESSVIDEQSGTYTAKLKYNIYNDALEHSSDSETFEITKQTTVHARINDSYFYYCNFKDQYGTPRNGYYILVELTHKYSIYKKLTLEINHPQEKSTISASSVPPKPGSLKVITTYYLEEAGVIVELPKNKKNMLATFSDKEIELKKYLKKEKIRFGKEEDLIRFVARYNALKSSDSIPASLLGNILSRN